MRFSIDIGGTFTDLVLEDNSGLLWIRKSPTTPDNPIDGILNVLTVAANDMGISLRHLLESGETLVHATTRPINALLTGSTAKTVLITTLGHRDILLFREGGRDRFNEIQPYPDPYIPRSLTFEISERIGSQGEIIIPLDEKQVIEVIETIKEKGIEAVAICFLWSFVNPIHENRVGELIEKHLPNIPFTLSHKLNPIMREYQRASSTAIDASLKPIMTNYLINLEMRLKIEGFKGRLLIVTSNGGVLDGETVAQAPIYSLKSGPSMAPVAGSYYGKKDLKTETVIVADTGGTSYDVSLVRKGVIPWTRETWIGAEYYGHMTGFSSIDVQSIGAGGGSIAWIDDGGLLHVGPQSAGSIPGPTCYGRGGLEPTVTDASLVLGYLDADYFLGGALKLDKELAEKVIYEKIAKPLSLNIYDAASAIMIIVTENMRQMIEEICINNGVDPRDAVLIGGGGAAGLHSVSLCKKISCSELIIPETGASLSAFGGLLSDLTGEFMETYVTDSTTMNFDKVNEVLKRLIESSQKFIKGPGKNSINSTTRLFAEVRYPSEIWELDVPLQNTTFKNSQDVKQLCQDFHRIHEDLFSTKDPESPVEVMRWRARVSCKLREGDIGRVRSTEEFPKNGLRNAYFPEVGFVETDVKYIETLKFGEKIIGPLIIESPITTIVIDPRATVERLINGSLIIKPLANL